MYIFPKYQENAHDVSLFVIYFQKPSKETVKELIYQSSNTLF